MRHIYIVTPQMDVKALGFNTFNDRDGILRIDSDSYVLADDGCSRCGKTWREIRFTGRMLFTDRTKWIGCYGSIRTHIFCVCEEWEVAEQWCIVKAYPHGSGWSRWMEFIPKHKLFKRLQPFLRGEV